MYTIKIHLYCIQLRMNNTLLHDDIGKVIVTAPICNLREQMVKVAYMSWSDSSAPQSFSIATYGEKCNRILDDPCLFLILLAEAVGVSSYGGQSRFRLHSMIFLLYILLPISIATGRTVWQVATHSSKRWDWHYVIFDGIYFTSSIDIERFSS